MKRVIGCQQTGCYAPGYNRNDRSTGVLLSSRPMAGNPSHPLCGWSLTPAGLLLFILLCCTGCENRDAALTFQSIPHYPASVPEQNMDGSAPAGVNQGELLQLSTTDPFDTVVEFYTGELSRYNPEVLSHSSGLGRQTAITIPRENTVLAVTIQEFGRQKRVAITHMGMQKTE